MQNGWLDGAGNAPSHQGLDWLSANFESTSLMISRLPHLYPTPRAGLKLSGLWRPIPSSLKFTSTPTKVTGSDSQKKDDDNEDSQIFDLDDADAWQQFTGEIRRLTGEEVKE